MCTAQKGPFEECLEDYECANTMYCWYSTPAEAKDGIKKCMTLHSQANGTVFGWKTVSGAVKDVNLQIEDFQQNGKYCINGVAY